MSKTPSNEKPLNRRQLLKVGALGSVGLIAAQTANTQSQPSNRLTQLQGVESPGGISVSAEKSSDFRVLEDLNQRIGLEESKRDQASYDWFVGLLAPELAFQRANEQKTINDREAFLKTVEPVKPGEPKPGVRETTINSIEIYGDRAVVACIVLLAGKKYHNLRLFVRRENQWKLLGWANEPV